MGTSKTTSGTTKTKTTTSVSQVKSSTSTITASATKTVASTNAAKSLDETTSANSKSGCNKSPSERLHLLNCDDDIPYADTDAAEMEANGTQLTSVPVSNPSQVSPTALLSYRDPSLHRASRILRSSTVSCVLFFVLQNSGKQLIVVSPCCPLISA